MGIKILVFFICSCIWLLAVVEADIGHARQLYRKNVANRDKSFKQVAGLEMQLHRPDALRDQEEEEEVVEKQQSEKTATEIANKSKSDTASVAQNSTLATHNVQRQTNKPNAAFQKIVRAGNKNENKNEVQRKQLQQQLAVNKRRERIRNQNLRRRRANNRNNRLQNNIISDNNNQNTGSNNNNDVNNGNRQIIQNAVNRLMTLMRRQGTQANNNINNIALNALNNALRQPQQQFQQLFNGK